MKIISTLCLLLIALSSFSQPAWKVDLQEDETEYTFEIVQDFVSFTKGDVYKAARKAVVVKSNDEDIKIKLDDIEDFQLLFQLKIETFTTDDYDTATIDVDFQVRDGRYRVFVSGIAFQVLDNSGNLRFSKSGKELCAHSGGGMGCLQSTIASFDLIDTIIKGVNEIKKHDSGW